MPHPPGPENLPRDERTHKVLFVDLDGVRHDRLMAARTPAIDALAATGQFGPSYLPDTAIAGTNSGPGHATMLTGVWPDRHRVLDNTFHGNALAEFPDVFTRLRAARPDLSTFSTADWPPLDEFLLASSVVRLRQRGVSTTATDRASTDAAVVELSDHDPDLLFVYQHACDDIGHTVGDASPEYLAAIETIDANIGNLVTAVRSRATHDDENWLILIGTDHGFAGTEHGGDDHSSRTGWLLASGGDLPHVGRAREWRQPDVAVSILHHLRVPIDAAWGLDGIPIGTASTDPFDTVELTDVVVDEPVKPPFSGGWSPHLPEGWTRAGATHDGTTEFRGWNLMTGEFWSTSGEGAGRGSFVRGRDTIAVADQGLWNATGSPAAAGRVYDSTLHSAWRAVVPDEPVAVTYLGHLRQPVRTGGRAELVVEFDEGTVEVLWSSAAEHHTVFLISTTMTHSTSAPINARRARFGWRLAGGTDGYWAIDAVRICS